MQSDLDQLMASADLDALLVVGGAAHNAAFSYFTGLVHVSRGYLIKPRGRDALLFCINMEREEAARTGFETHSLEDLGMMRFFEEAQGDVTLSNAMLIRHIFETNGIEGRVALYGKTESGPLLATIRHLESLAPSVEIVAEPRHDAVVTRARETKDAAEAERIRQVGEITIAVVADVANFLTSHAVQDGVLVDRRGTPLTVGDVRQKINLWLAMRGAENPEGSIFAVGRDAGIPHSVGSDSDRIPVGTAIVFDIYPCEAGGGYFYDFTRTWCLGYAPDEVQSAYEDVMATYDQLYAELRPGGLCREYQAMTCRAFEARGHPTIGSDPTLREGYVHSLAHGLGLDVHEAPRFTDSEGNEDRLKVGSVITVEPGLYYPERGFGVRVEDTVLITEEGPQTLATFPKDLVLKMPGLHA